ncbi:hypothetical protein [Kallipyga massiliensis]|uniref:hypothetical protein n=1 Tax=Kallipyga massiliensis TaxID=1472764 RepID=UPI0004B7CC78|nr:hypothetical protein [Kallipyga massiliensis]
MKSGKYRLLIVALAIILAACSGKGKTSEGSESQGQSGVGQTSQASATTGISTNLAAGGIKDAKARGKLVQGASAGSMSDHVEDREVWKDFIEPKHEKAAKNPFNGVHVPRILLDSEDAQRANKQIEETINFLKETYNTVKNDLDPDYIMINSTFSVYEDDQILSIHLQYKDGGDGTGYTHKVFNFTLDDGKFIKDEDLLTYLGIDKEEAMNLMEESIAYDYQRRVDAMDYHTENYYYLGDVTHYEGMALQDLWEGKDLPERRFYLDPTGRPMFIFNAYYIWGVGLYLNTLELYSKKVNDRGYSPQFVKMARAMGLDPYDEKIKGLILYVGYANAEKELEDMLARLDPCQNIFNDFVDPRLLLATRENQNFENSELIGEDYYLVVPKWDKATVSLKEIKTEKDGSVKEVENNILDTIAQRSTTLICQRQEKGTTNIRITIRYRDEKIEMSPMINEKKEIINLPEGIIDAGKAADLDGLKKKGFYSIPLFQKILSVMGRG